MNLATKTAQYKSHGKIARLLHIIIHSNELSIPALRILYEYLENNSKDTHCARRVAHALSSIDKSSVLNAEWITEKKRQTNNEKQKLHDELSKASAEVYASRMAVCVL